MISILGSFIANINRTAQPATGEEVGTCATILVPASICGTSRAARRRPAGGRPPAGMFLTGRAPLGSGSPPLAGLLHD